MEPQKFKVHLYLYDISNGMARQFSPFMVGKLVEAIYHSSIVCFGTEYFFGGGICRGFPKVNYNKFLFYQNTPYGLPIKEIVLTDTEIPQDLFEIYLNEIENKYTVEKYNFLTNNCNHFTNEICEFLTGNPIPDYVLKQHEQIQGTPFGNMILGMLQNMGAQNNQFLPQAFEGKK